MRDEKRITQADIDAAEVRLRPFAGMAPRVWLTAAFGSALAAILFALLILPGILRPGTWISLSGTPSDAAVWVDSSYRGSARAAVFVSPGDHDITLTRPGFAPATLKVRAGNRLIGSLFAPARRGLPYTLQITDAQAELARAVGEYSRWANTGKPTAVWQVPSALSDGLSALAESGALASGGPLATAPEAAPARIARVALAASTSPQSLRDGLRATFIASGARHPAPLALVSGLRAALAAAATPVTAAWLADYAAGESAKLRAALPDSKTGTPAVPANAAPSVTGTDSVAGVAFVKFSGGSRVLQGLSPSDTSLPYIARIEPFALAATETTVGQWAAFLADNPEWRPDRRDTLIQAGLADAAYLADWNPAADSRLPVTGVSWHAASAYCEWLSRRADPGYRVVLPTEAMWEAGLSAGGARFTNGIGAPAVWARAELEGPERVGSRGAAASGLFDMLGNVWEWTADGYLAYPAFAPEGVSVPEKTVRGGSWANAANAVQPGSRGGIESAHASAFLGFRPALVRR